MVKCKIAITKKVGIFIKSPTMLLLNSWLSKADSNYLEGRLLWFQLCTNGACNLLWLASEQIMKTLIIQDYLLNNDTEELELNELFDYVDEEIARRLGHRPGKLIQKIRECYEELEIVQFSETLNKLQEYFYRRYVNNSSSSLNLNMFNEVDDFYFRCRSKIDSNVEIALIDEIFIQKKYKQPHPLEAYKFAYFKNTFFEPRNHPALNFISIEGTIISESGIYN